MHVALQGRVRVVQDRHSPETHQNFNTSFRGAHLTRGESNLFKVVQVLFCTSHDWDAESVHCLDEPKQIPADDAAPSARNGDQLNS